MRTRKSLCIVDEFGKGTAPVDGIALLAATVRNFTVNGGKALFVLHFTEIVHPSVLDAPTMARVSCFCMETFKQKAPSKGGEAPVALIGGLSFIC
jgi:DNA mismatch repair protein MSH5